MSLQQLVEKSQFREMAFESRHGGRKIVTIVACHSRPELAEVVTGTIPS